ncbi:uncharacterized protein LOC132729909 [Ruditapes philippinarum]|uniref:uncharacterized protein LOC132729909 n=1 Tax=Ruditapes philippinarum TaxID=129788 RepID=UPI00295AADA5|nr:uncharacterized protein LOC132729909 [Ruditapes philippinarum]
MALSHRVDFYYVNQTVSTVYFHTDLTRFVQNCISVEKMFKIVCLLVCVGIVLSERPEYGTEHCKNVLATDCSGYSPEPVCAFDGHNHVTYQNSCEFAHGICSHHGHSLHALHQGPCTGTETL